MITFVVTEIFHFQYFEVVFNSRSSSFCGYVQKDPISGYWEIQLFILIFLFLPLTRGIYFLISTQLFIFWGRLPLEVIFILRICKIWFCHLSLCLKVEYDQISGCWYILYIFSLSSLVFRGQVVFLWRLSSFEEFVKFGWVT